MNFYNEVKLYKTINEVVCTYTFFKVLYNAGARPASLT